VFSHHRIANGRTFVCVVVESGDGGWIVGIPDGNSEIAT
jgi:hypothetical protein